MKKMLVLIPLLFSLTGCLDKVVKSFKPSPAPQAPLMPPNGPTYSADNRLIFNELNAVCPLNNDEFLKNNHNYMVQSSSAGSSLNEMFGNFNILDVYTCLDGILVEKYGATYNVALFGEDENTPFPSYFASIDGKLINYQSLRNYNQETGTYNIPVNQYQVLGVARSMDNKKILLSYSSGTVYDNETNNYSFGEFMGGFGFKYDFASHTYTSPLGEIQLGNKITLKSASGAKGEFTCGRNENLSTTNLGDIVYSVAIPSFFPVEGIISDPVFERIFTFNSTQDLSQGNYVLPEGQYSVPQGDLIADPELVVSAPAPENSIDYSSLPIDGRVLVSSPNEEERATVIRLYECLGVVLTPIDN